MADFDKGQGEVLDWTLLDDIATDDPFAETGLQTRPDELMTGLQIVVAHKDANNAAGNNVVVSVLVRAGGDNEAWRELVSFQADAGQALAEALNANSGVSQGNPERLEVVSTADWDTGEPVWLFLLDSGNLVDSCLCLVRGWADNDYYINAWNLIRDYDNADILYDTVSQFRVSLPEDIQFFNVVFHNPDGTATYAVRVDYTEVTDIA